MNVRVEFLQQYFAISFGKRLAEMVRLAEAGDIDKLHLAFHSLAGVAGTYGYPEVSEIARHGERHAETGDLVRARRTIARLVQLRDGLRAA